MAARHLFREDFGGPAFHLQAPSRLSVVTRPRILYELLHEGSDRRRVLPREAASS